MKEKLFTNIVVKETPEHEVCFTSDKTIYIEALVGGRWVGRYWAVDGCIDHPRRFTEPAFELKVKENPKAAAGTLLSNSLKWVSASELQKTSRGGRHFVVELENTIHPIRVKVHTLLDGTPVLTRWLEITNTSSKPVALTAVSPWSGRLWDREAPITLGHSTRWADQWNGWLGWTPLSQGANVFEQDRGLAYDDPYFILRNESNGEYFFGQLSWSANYIMEFQKENGLKFKIGPSAINALRVIAAGEKIATPAVHLGYVNEDFDSTVQAMHEHIRRSVLPERKPEKSYLVQYLSPEDQPFTVYRGEQYNETTVKKCMDVAAAVGIEVFIVDGPTWCSAYGNWFVPDKKRFPNGLGPLVEYARQKGLLFGLYAEPEGGREGYRVGEEGAYVGPWSQSKVFQQHPDWFVQPNSVLNLSIKEAAAYMEVELAQIVEHYKLDLYRHDFNSPLRGQGSETLRDGFVENDYWRHYEAFYGIFERLHAKYQDLILQQASAGGCRLDLGTIGRFHEHYTTDRAACPDLYQTANGLSVYLPPEVLVGPNGMAGPNQPDFVTMLRAVYAIGNTPMIFNAMLPKSIGEFQSGVKEKFLHYSNIYKTFIRPLLPTCKVYHHAPINATAGTESRGWFAMEFTAPSQKKGWATIIRLVKNTPDTYLFKPKGLDGRVRYSVTFDNSGKKETFSGSALMRDGLPIRLEADPCSELLLFEAQ